METQWHLDLQFASNAGRLTNMRELRPLLQAAVKRWCTSPLGEALDSHGISWGNIHTMEQVFQHPQVVHRQMLQTIEHPTFGTLKLVRNPMVWPNKQNTVRPPPALGPSAVENAAPKLT